MIKIPFLKNFTSEILANEKEYDLFINYVNEIQCVVCHKDAVAFKALLEKLLAFEDVKRKYSPTNKTMIDIKCTFTYFDTFYFDYDKPFFAFNTTFLDYVLKHVKNSKIYGYRNDAEEVDEKEVNDFIESLNLPHKPMPHQYECFRKSIQLKRLTNESATSSGKSLIIYMLCMWMIHKMSKQVYIVVPTITLVNQMLNDFKSYNMSDYIKISKVNSVERKKGFIDNPNIIITTWQSLCKDTFPYDVKQIECIIIDECHILKENASVLNKFLAPNTPKAKYRFGFSGTIPKCKELRYNIISYCGEVNEVIQTKQLIEEGKATNVIVKCINLHIPKELHHNHSKKTFSNYQQRYVADKSFIYNLKQRDDFIVNMLKKLYKDKITIVLYDNIEFGNKILELLRNSLKTSNDEVNVFKIDGSVEGKEREEIRQKIENIENGVLFGTHQCISTGMNIPKLNTMVYLFSTKSDIIVNQSIGRLIRKHKTKEIATLIDVVDIFDGLKRSLYTKNHFKERLAIYEHNKYEIQTYDAYVKE